MKAANCVSFASSPNLCDSWEGNYEDVKTYRFGAVFSAQSEAFLSVNACVETFVCWINQ